MQVLSALMFFLSLPAAAGTCGFTAPPTVVLNDGKQLLQFWEVDDSPKWTSTLLPDSTGYWRFVRYASARLDVLDLNRYIAAYLNLHNHNFDFAKTPIVPGVPWPNVNDAQAMKNFPFDDVPFEITAVTNGFTTSRLRPGELKRFRGADGK